MKKEDLKKIKKQVEKKLKKRLPTISKSEIKRVKNASKYKSFLRLTLFSIILSIYYNINYEFEFIFQSLLIIGALSSIALTSYFLSREKPKGINLDEWYWKTTRKYQYSTLISVSFILMSMIFFSKPNILTTFTLLFFYFAFVLAILLLLIINFKPFLFLNLFYTKLISFLLTLSGLLFISSIILYFTKYSSLDTTNKYYPFIVLMISIVFTTILHWEEKKEKRKLNIAQKLSLKMIRPAKINNSLMNRSEIINEEIKGMKYLKDIYSENSFTIEKIIATELNSKQKSNVFTKYLIPIITSVLLVFYNKVTEILIFSENVNSFLCEVLGILCK